MSQLTEVELQSLKNLRNEADNLSSTLGGMNYQKILLEEDLETIKKAVINNKKAQQEFFKELSLKYENGNINIETGEITPVQQS
jgi:hypothetical protein